MYISLIILAVGLVGVIIGMAIEAGIYNSDKNNSEPPVEDTVEIIELSEEHIEQPGEAVVDKNNYFEPF